MTVAWRELRAEAVERLTAAGVASPEADARWIVEQAAGAPPDEVGDEAVTERGIAAFDRMLARRETGEPLQHVLGRWGFRTLDLFVDSRVLIPRPETEVVAGAAIDELGARTGVQTVVDLGTGSGAIALAIAAECWPNVEVWATDASADALAVASANLSGLGRRAASVRVCEGSWFTALPDELRGRVDVIVSNPPYVADGDELPPEVADWEPHRALFAGPDGTDDLRRIIEGAREWLRPDGALVVELDPRQVPAMVHLALASGFDQVDVGQDLTGRDRHLICR